MPRLKAKHSLCSYNPRIKSLPLLPQEPGLLSALAGALQSSAAVQELGTEFSEASARCGCPQSLPRSAREGRGLCSQDADRSGHLLRAAEWQWGGALGVPVCPAHPTPKNSRLSLCFSNTRVEFLGQEAACAPCHAPGPGAGADTYTSTPVECRELCQFTGRNSTRPTCCCSCAFLKCACSMLRETFLKSFTAEQKISQGDAPGSGASPWHQHHLIR